MFFLSFTYVESKTDVILHVQPRTPYQGVKPSAEIGALSR